MNEHDDWKVSLSPYYRGFVVLDGQNRVLTSIEVGDFSPAEAEAHAHLLARAPALKAENERLRQQNAVLLEACEVLYISGDGNERCVCFDPFGGQSEGTCCWCKARAAIAEAKRARGEEADALDENVATINELGRERSDVRDDWP